MKRKLSNISAPTLVQRQNGHRRCVRSLISALVYHFVLRADTEDEDPTSTHLTPAVDITSQKENILKMSHGVTVILLLGKTQRVSPN